MNKLVFPLLAGALLLPQLATAKVRRPPPDVRLWPSRETTIKSFKTVKRMFTLPAGARPGQAFIVKAGKHSRHLLAPDRRGTYRLITDIAPPRVRPRKVRGNIDLYCGKHTTARVHTHGKGNARHTLVALVQHASERIDERGKCAGSTQKETWLVVTPDAPVYHIRSDLPGEIETTRFIPSREGKTAQLCSRDRDSGKYDVCSRTLPLPKEEKNTRRPFAAKHWLILAKDAQAEKHMARAQQLYDQAVKLAPDDPHTLYNAALVDQHVWTDKRRVKLGTTRLNRAMKHTRNPSLRAAIHHQRFKLTRHHATTATGSARVSHCRKAHSHLNAALTNAPRHTKYKDDLMMERNALYRLCPPKPGIRIGR